MEAHVSISEIQTEEALRAALPYLLSQVAREPAEEVETLEMYLSAPATIIVFDFHSSGCSGLSALLTYGRGTGKRDIKGEFAKLTEQWKKDRRAASSTSSIVTHQAYQRIISMGAEVVPYILKELERELDHWFWALKVITGHDPVPPENRGNMKKMADAWIAWGKERSIRAE